MNEHYRAAGAGTIVLFSSTQPVDGEVTNVFNLFERAMLSPFH